MTCKICGQQLPEDSTVCKYCGAHVKTGGTQKKPARRYSKKGLARKRMINLVITLLALLLIAVVVVGVVWSAKLASEKGQGTLQGDDALLENESGTRPVEPSNVPETGKDNEQQESLKPEEPEADKKEEQPEETQKPEEEKQEEPKQEEPKEEPPADSQQKEPETTQQPQQQTPSGKYTISINRTETTASLNHYRELYVYINETLPSGVKVVSTTWTSSNPNVVRADPGKAWGISIGSATVTGTITLSDGQSLSASCKVNVVESQSSTGTGTGTGSGTTTGSSGYVLAESSTRLITAAELDNLTSYQLWIARNEIYARHGRKFTNTELQTYFNGKSWYNGTIAPENFDESVLSTTERKNVDAIMAEEATR